MSAKISKEATEAYSDALADVLCWFHGFYAAFVGKDDQPNLPPGLYALRELKDAMDEVALGERTQISSPGPKMMPF